MIHPSTRIYFSACTLSRFDIDALMDHITTQKEAFEKLQRENDKLKAQIAQLQSKKRNGLFPKNPTQPVATVDESELNELKEKAERFRQQNISLRKAWSRRSGNQQMSDRIRTAEEAQKEQRLRLDEREETIETLTQQNSDLTELKELMAAQSREMAACTLRLTQKNSELNAENEQTAAPAQGGRPRAARLARPAACARSTRCSSIQDHRYGGYAESAGAAPGGASEASEAAHQEAGGVHARKAAVVGREA